MKFNYKARTKDGKVETGVIEAYSKEDAAAILQKYHIFTTSLEEEVAKESLFYKIEFSKKVPKKDLAIFFRQLSIMLESGVPVVKSLTSLAAQTHKVSFKEAIGEISNLVQEGLPLSGAFGAYPHIFNNFYINLIKSGEASGKISEAFYYVSEQLEKESDIISQVRQAMIYPAFVIMVLFVSLFIIITQLIPKITDLIYETNVAPSFFTGIMLGFYGFLGNYWWLLLLIGGALTLFLIYYFTTKEGKRMYDKVSLKIPIINDFLKKVFLVRFCSNISTLLIAGVSINKALKITEDTVNNIEYRNMVSEMGEKVSEGEKMSSVMERHQDFFPLFIVQMVRVGEETGKLSKILREIVNFYQKEIKRMVDLFSVFLEPIIIIFLGIVIAILAVSVLSALYGSMGVI